MKPECRSKVWKSLTCRLRSDSYYPEFVMGVGTPGNSHMFCGHRHQVEAGLAGAEGVILYMGEQVTPWEGPAGDDICTCLMEGLFGSTVRKGQLNSLARLECRVCEL